MNKKFLFLGIAASMFMASCSSDDATPGSPEAPQNSNEAIMLTLSQQASSTRAALGNVDQDGAFDGTFDTDSLGIYCLATGKIYGTENINWADYNNPNFMWLENVRAKAVTSAYNEGNTRWTDLSWYDGQKRYYPLGSQYSYTFYGYYPYNSNVVKSGNEYYLDIKNLDGVTDVIWGKTYSEDSLAYSALYFREKKAQDGASYNQRNYLPQVVFKHKLMKFNIILKKGTGDDLDKIGIKKATLHNVATGGRLYIASLDGTKDGKFVPNWNNTTTLTLKTADDQPLGEENFLGKNSQILVGGGFMLPELPRLANGNYTDNGFRENGMANKGVFRLRVDFNKQNDATIYKAAQYEIVPPADGWKEGHEYDIVITVSTPLEIQSTAKLTPWEKGTIELQ